jgi:hypothetical protein
MRRAFSIALALAVFLTSAFAEQHKMTCRITGKKLDKCCCEMKNGKFHCKLTKKTYNQCCCDMK